LFDLFIFNASAEGVIKRKREYTCLCGSCGIDAVSMTNLELNRIGIHSCEACQDDRAKEEGNRKAQEKGKNCITHRGATTNGRPSKIASEETKKSFFCADIFRPSLASHDIIPL